MRKLYTIAIMLILVFALAACGGDNDGPGLGNFTAYVENDDAPWAEAYLDILTEKSALLTSDESYMFLDDGKIVVTEVFGNEAPELLYIYIPEDNPYCSRLMIMSYSDATGAVPVFDSIINVMAGGGGNYCVFLTRGGKLITYFSMYGEFSYFGFWSIEPMSSGELADLYDPYNISFFDYENRTNALLFYNSYPDYDNFDEFDDWVLSYMIDGAEISEDEFYERAAEIMGDIDRVLFHSTITDVDEYGLYERDDLWKVITPFTAESMTYKEAVSWLETLV